VIAIERPSVVKRKRVFGVRFLPPYVLSLSFARGFKIKLRAGVDAAIALNYQTRFMAVEVDNILANLMSPSKL
jgi:hypothetical protein